jgi:hemolysin III
VQQSIPHREELVNAITHGLGVIASIAGGAVLVTLAALSGNMWQIIGASVFCASLILLYSASTLYHSARHETARARLQVFDHCAIFVLIAGTYTPFTLVSLRGSWGWPLFGLVWGLALAGVVFKLFCTGRYRRLSTLMYIGMGWLALAATGPMLRALPVSTIAWLLAGGSIYTAGTFFYHSRRIPYAHAIWHFFVLGGSVCHFIAVLSQVVPSHPA